jgi:Tfp pilus assembly protein PilO
LISLLTIISGVWYLAGISAQVRMNTTDIKRNVEIISTLPTRTEFDGLIKKVDEIGVDVKTLLRSK